MAQEYKLTGKVINQKGDPMKLIFANLTDKDSTNTTRIQIDSLGFFSFKAKKGDYTLAFYQFNTKLYTVNVPLMSDKNLDDIKINEAIKLETVIVTGKQKLIERKPDRLIFNVERSAASTGGDALDALSITPLVKLEQNGQIAISGRSGVAIMINEKIIHISGTELTNYLRSLRSDDISKIEVITVPPAKYEAQGNSGIINIKLKKNLNLGFDGYVGTKFSQNTYSSVAENLGLNYGNSKLTASFKASYFDDYLKAKENYDIIGTTFSSLGPSVRKDNYRGTNLNTSLDYNVSKNGNIGFIYNYGYNINKKYINERRKYLNRDLVTNQMHTLSDHDGNTPSHTVNAYYDLKLGMKGSKISFSTNYLERNTKNAVNFTTNDNILDSTFNVTTDAGMKYSIWSSQGDITLHTNLGKLDFGTKYTEFKNQSTNNYFNNFKEVPVIDKSKSNEFDYFERNYAAYLSGARDIGEKWSLQLGLRYEYSDVRGISQSNNDITRNKYGKIFPSAFVSYSPTDNSSFTLSYSRRINRPGFRELDPFRWYSNPNNYSTGNPKLSPSFNHNIELTYLLNGKFSMSAYYQKLVDGYNQITTLDSISEITNYYNYFNQKSYGLNLTFTDKFFKCWEINNSLDISYSKSHIYSSDMLAQSGTGMRLSTSNTFELDKNSKYYLLLNFWQDLPSREGNSFLKTRAAFQAGGRMFLLNKKLMFSLILNDIFRQLRSRSIEYFEDNTQYSNNYYDARNITLNIKYTFGKKKAKRKIKNIEFEEANRAN